MAFNPNEMLIDRVRYVVAHDIKTDEKLFMLTELEEASLNTSAEGEDVTDAVGALITTIYRSKQAEFTATNSLFSLDLAAAQFGAKKEVASWPVLGKLFKHYGYIFIDRKRKGGDLHSLKEALKVLKNGESLALFPEGTRSKTGKMGKAKAGIGFLVYHSGAPIVPIRVIDTNKLPFTWGPKVIFGKAFNVKADETRPVKEQYQEFADKVMNEIKKLK